jgi:DNA-binding MarR family transcriptional regulator
MAIESVKADSRYGGVKEIIRNNRDLIKAMIISDSDFRVLEFIEKVGPVRVCFIAESFGWSSPYASRVLKKLVRKGWAIKIKEGNLKGFYGAL